MYYLHVNTETISTIFVKIIEITIKQNVPSPIEKKNTLDKSYYCPGKSFLSKRT